MGLFGRMTVEECVREAYDTFTEEAKPYLFPEGVRDAAEIVNALGEACGVGKKAVSAKRCEDLLDLWAEMVRCAELDQNRGEKIRLMRKKYSALVPGETVGDRVCNWCEKKMAARSEETETDSGMEPCAEVEPEENFLPVEPEVPEETEPETESAPETETVPESKPETEPAPETEPVPEMEPASEMEPESEPEMAEEAPMNIEVPEEAEPSAPARPDPKTVAKTLKDVWNLNEQECKPLLESLKPRRKEWVDAVLARQEGGVRGAVGSVFLAGFVAAGGKTADQAVMRDLLKRYLRDTEAEVLWSEAETPWKREVLKVAWQLGARMGTETEPRDPKTGETETLTGGTEDETLC